MVRALLDGSKTQTRRVVKWKPLEGDSIYDTWKLGKYHSGNPESGFVLRSRSGAFGCWEDRTLPIKCPYGMPGDLLWVRETWRPCGWDAEEDEVNIEFRAGGTAVKYYDDWYDRGKRMGMIEKICIELDKKGILLFDEEGRDGDHPDFDDDTAQYVWEDEYPISWRPSIHLPKAAARIWLRVTGVRVERLLDITDEDAIAEGVEQVHHSFPAYRNYVSPLNRSVPNLGTARDSFCSLWTHINGADSWNDNPWVWVVEFEVVSPSTSSGTDLDNSVRDEGDER